MIDIETTEAFLKVFEYLSEKFGIAVDLTNKNIIPYLQQLGNKIVAYEKNIAIMWIIVGAILGILSLVIFFIGCAQDWEMMHWVVLICGVLIAACIVITNMYVFIGCNTFEEKIILDYLDRAMSNINN